MVISKLVIRQSNGNYLSKTREIQRGEEFVEKYASYELNLYLRPEVRRK
jgi:hypothetical protein